jgi:glutamyl-tRNA(Gln) amidotransferase subunit E
MRPTLSELGEYDGTALMEFKTRKEIVYRLNRGSTCTYEIDDTPPFEIDEEAVRSAIEIALLFNLNLVSELHVMRKQYLDGSIPTGFQRTAMVGLTGAIPFRVPELGIDRELRIRQLSLEEDSCREVTDIGHRITFRTDRLGMPLTEAVTEPDLLTPYEVEAGGRLMARIARASGKVRRGPGAARQDVNVSVAGGRRVEIKGVDNHRNLPLLVHVEAYRQLNLLRVRAEMVRRGIDAGMLALPATGLPWEISENVVDAGPVLKDCEFAPIRDALERGETVCALRLPGFAGLLAHPTQPGVTFAREFADRLRVVACLEDRPFMVHSEGGGYFLNRSDWRDLYSRLRSTKEDSVIVLWGPKEDAATGAREAFLRAIEALEGVPAETRQAFPDGTNGFERILPGPDRMYPDTDTPPLPIPDRWVTEITSDLPERPWVRERRYIGLGLGEPAARRLASSDWAALFDELEPPAGDAARWLAYALEKRVPWLRRKGVLASALSGERLRPLTDAVAAGNLLHRAIEPAMIALVEDADEDAAVVLDRFRPRSGDEAELDRRVGETAAAAARLDGKPNDVLERWAMGEIVPHFVGRVEPSLVRGKLAAAGVLAGGEGRS